MKRITVGGVLGSLAVVMAPAITGTPTLQAASDQYTITELATLGGTVGAADSINDKGWVAGYANLPGDRTEHAALWIDSVVIDLTTLGGPNSSVGFPAKNNKGLLVGFSQTANSDPLRENWNYTCATGGRLCQGKNLITHGFIWQNGKMEPLPPILGGNTSEAFGINNSAQAVGMAETGYADPTCIRPQVLAYFGVVWNPDGSIQRQLQPYGDDHISVAVGINDAGEVVGGSGPCAPLSPSIGAHALLWQNGSTTATDLGNFGGTTNNVAFAINQNGQIVGFSGLPGNTTAHAFIWQNDAMTDLGTLPGDVFSLALSINNNGQIVGESCDAKGTCRACLWQNGSPTDLNTLVVAGSTARLLVATDINNEGQIVGQAYDQTSGNTIGFVATPD